MGGFRLTSVTSVGFLIFAFLLSCDYGKTGNVSPTASFTAQPAEGDAPLTVAFDGSASIDPDGHIQSYLWNLGDGETGSGVQITHTYQSAGDYTVTLTVTDNQSGIHSASQVIKVNPAPPDNDDLLEAVKFWAYQIQGLEEEGAVNKIVQSRYDMVVIEPTRTDWSDTDTMNFDTRGMVSRIKSSSAHNGNDPKLVIAYVDIGEAEDWRWYWVENNWPRWKQGWPRPSGLPEWILAQDPDGWAGNFPVVYWNEEWQDIMIYGQYTGTHPDRDYTSMLDELIKDGFDGIYLDWVEAFDNEEVKKAAKKAGLDPAEAMITFIARIRAWARDRDPDFLVIQQNASFLLTGRPHLLNNIDAIAQEGIWYWNIADVDWDNPRGHDQPTDPDLSSWLISHLEKYQQRGLPVFCVEYALKKAPRAYSLATQLGYIPYCSRSSLFRLTTTPPPGY